MNESTLETTLSRAFPSPRLWLLFALVGVAYVGGAVAADVATMRPDRAWVLGHLSGIGVVLLGQRLLGGDSDEI